jgi:hypothetical protein
VLDDDEEEDDEEAEAEAEAEAEDDGAAPPLAAPAPELESPLLRSLPRAEPSGEPLILELLLVDALEVGTSAALGRRSTSEHGRTGNAKG